jgi:hypothetical protein
MDYAPDQPAPHHDPRPAEMGHPQGDGPAADPRPLPSGERPWSVKAMVALVGLAWAGIMAFNALSMDDFWSGRSLGITGFWTAVLAVWTYWIWQGAPAAMGRLGHVCSVLSAVAVVWLVFGNLFLKRFRELGLELDGSQWLAANGCALLFASVTFAVFLLVHRKDARRWAEARARERRTR